VAKQMLFDEEARQSLLAGVSKLSRPFAARSAREGERRARQRLGVPQDHQRRRDRGGRHRSGQPERKPRCSARERGASKTNDVAGDGTTTATVLAESIYAKVSR